MIKDACINGLYQNITIIKQFKYTIEVVSKVPVHQEQVYFARLRLGK